MVDRWIRETLEAALAVVLLSLVVGLAIMRNPAAMASAAGASSGQVAFIRDGALWVQPLQAGEPRRLWEGAVSYPRWSPSGEWLLVNERDRFRIIPAGGQATAMALEGVGAAWSPRADLLAYRDPAGNLRVTDPAGKQERVVVDTATRGDVGAPFWSPDGAWLAFEMGSGIWRVKAEGGEPVQVLALETGERTCLKLAGWSPDGGAVLYWPVALCSQSLLADGAPLMAVPVQGGPVREIVGRMLVHKGFLANSPATAQIAVAAGGGRMTWHTKWIEVVDLPAGTGRRISPTEMAATSPAWSPDGRQIAFVAMPDAGPEVGGGERARTAMMERRIWLVGPDGQRLSQLTRDPGYRDESPRWAGDRLLFARLDQEDQASLWIIDPGGAKAGDASPRRLAAVDAPPNVWFGYYGWLDWSAVFDVHAG